MRVISFVTQKGGAGQDDARRQLRRRRREDPAEKRLILDLDPQGSAEAWYQDREAETPRLVRIASWSLPEAIAKAKIRLVTTSS